MIDVFKILNGFFKSLIILFSFCLVVVEAIQENAIVLILLNIISRIELWITEIAYLSMSYIKLTHSRIVMINFCNLSGFI